jgi:hypothetical protein
MNAARANMDRVADSICRSRTRLLRFSMPILPMGCNTPVFSPRSCDPLPPRFVARLAVFIDLFTRPTWLNVLTLLAGVILAPGRRTVTAALRILGESAIPISVPSIAFSTGRHGRRGLRRADCCSCWSRSSWRLGGPVVIGIDDTIERRWGPRNSARGIYRDAVRSSKGHFVKASGLRWLSAMLLVRVPWVNRVMALPFLTLLAPSGWRRTSDDPSTSLAVKPLSASFCGFSFNLPHQA